MRHMYSCDLWHYEHLSPTLLDLASVMILRASKKSCLHSQHGFIEPFIIAVTQHHPIDSAIPPKHPSLCYHKKGPPFLDILPTAFPPPMSMTPSVQTLQSKKLRLWNCWAVDEQETPKNHWVPFRIISGQIVIFHPLDFPEIRGFPLNHGEAVWGRYSLTKYKRKRHTVRLDFYCFAEVAQKKHPNLTLNTANVTAPNPDLHEYIDKE